MSWLSNPDLRLPWLALSFALSFAVATLAIAYAHRANVIDQPGQRRSHRVPTPRGGGIGIVLCALLAVTALPLWNPAFTEHWRLAASVGALALIGWIDDHRSLPAWLRFIVQLGAVAVWLAPLLRQLLALSGAEAIELDITANELLGLALLLGFTALWSINLHNFMDGIDGLLALQGIFVLGVLAWFGMRDPDTTHASLVALWAAAVAGFLPLNFPRARIFMGDVGSGAIGLLIAVAVVWQTSSEQVAAATGLIAVSAFLTDATCTLLSRMLRGRRWYSAHREHLYQWMTRTGMTHARVVTWYMSWNVLVVLPILCWINRVPEHAEPLPLQPGYGWAAGVYALAVTLWICGKRYCERRVRLRKTPAAEGVMHATA
jgi:UDP-N-acetylmuramyl pentapeptide phosphotransferase/UDP-N-acetylglucosamine-1-phosphate transferase